ncbi:alkane 1-monooxygenase [Advenella faeciporci]|uniref:Luciferase-like monooxygenase n=1 Tax=Advenella faeciporci TaxID=797535 RepID=A0A918JJE3_9BURK|nr:LLM class flavin-dependent oxidoreductase [Advenella faeciporci]GGW78776.1 alkane 1-monooxygenase [Advenella faeciporci]
MVPFSILDLSPINENETVGDALGNSLQLAKKAEECGFTRFWLAEHHNIPGIASSATSVAIGYIAAGTSRIRVGSGGVMLPNHSPLIIAEQFGTLASLYPNRIDLGLGRAPGTDMNTARALRRDLRASAENFPQDVQELQYYFRQPEEGQQIVAVPAAGVQVPVWLLGSSLYSAQLAAYLGLPFSFASHFAPADLMNALSVYRSSFRPSVYLDKPYASACVNVVAAQTDELAKYHFTSHQMASVQLLRNAPGKLQPPVDNLDDHVSPAERASIEHKLVYSMVGSPKTVAHGISRFVEMTGVDELMITARVYDVEARLKSVELVSSAF